MIPRCMRSVLAGDPVLALSGLLLREIVRHLEGGVRSAPSQLNSIARRWALIERQADGIERPSVRIVRQRRRIEIPAGTRTAGADGQRAAIPAVAAGHESRRRIEAAGPCLPRPVPSD